MKRYIIAAISILAFAASMVSCTDHKVIRQLNDVEAYLNEHPDSALTVLDSISTAGIQGREANAKFALLYSMALDKSYIDVDNDSILAHAIKYYRKYGTPADRMKTLFYQARIQFNAEDYQAAIVTLSKAEKLAGQIPDSLYLGMIYSDESVIYNINFNSSEEYRYARMAYECFAEAGMEDRALIAKYSLGVSYHSLRQYDEAIGIYREVLPLFIEKQDTAMITECMKSYAFTAAVKDPSDPETCIRMFTDVINVYHEPLSVKEYGSLAYAYALKGDYNTADAILSQIRRYPESWFWIYKADRLSGKYREALESLEEATSRQDSVVHSTLQESSAKALGTYYKLQTAVAENRAANLRLLVVTLVFSLLVFTAAVILVLRHKKIRQEAERELLLSIAETSIREKEQEKGKFERQLADLRRTISSQRKSRFSILKELCEKYTLYEGRGDQQKFIREHIMPMLDSIRKDSGSHSDFEDMIDRGLDNVIQKLRADMKNFTENDFILISYVIAGFDASLIARLMDINKNDVYSRKHRLTARILKAETGNAGLYKEIFVQ